MAKTSKPIPSPEPATRPRLDYPNSMTAVADVAECMDTPLQPDESLYKGKWRNQRDGFLYKHCVFPHPLGKDHKAIVPKQKEYGEPGYHSGLFWEGNAEDFHNTFRMESPE